MKKPTIQNKRYVMVFDTESNTKTGALTSWQVAPVLDKRENEEYPITEEDCVYYRVPLLKGHTRICMDKFISFIKDNFELGTKIDFYVHNLKWDIQFLLNYIIKDLNYQPENYDLLITNLGQVFYLSFDIEGYNLKFIDSLKILPFTLDEAGRAYNTKYKKIKGENYNGILSKEYIINDVLCLSELIAIQNTLGINNKVLTTSSWALKDYRNRLAKSELGLEIAKKECEEIDNFSATYKAKLVKEWREKRIKNAKREETKDHYLQMSFDEVWERVNKERKSIVNSPSFIYRKIFPQIDDITLPTSTLADCKKHDFISLDSYCRQGYRGGLTYCNPDTRNKIFISEWFYNEYKDKDEQLKEILKMPKDRWQVVKHLYHYDVHSLYPSKCLYGYKEFTTYPIKKPTLLWGCPDEKLIEDTFNNKAHFMIRFKCKFDIKSDDIFPSIQIKGDFHDPTDWLKTSKLIIDEKDYDKPCVLTLTDVEFFDFITRYNIRDLEWIDYAVFRHVETGHRLFDCYMDFYYKEKAKAKGDFVKYQAVKQKLNSLTGKFGTNPFGYKKKCILENGIIKLKTQKYIEDEDKLSKKEKAMYKDLKEKYLAIGREVKDDERSLRKNSEYVPVIAWITAYGRLTLLSEMDNASNNFEKNKSVYITGDTDSLFVAADKEWEPKLGVSDSDLNTFGLEHDPEEVAMFSATGQKCYAIYGNFYVKAHKRKEWGYDIKVAGMTQTQKDKFVKDSEFPMIDFANEEVKVEGGKLMAMPTYDGAVLVPTDFKKTSKTYTVKQATADKKLWKPEGDNALELFACRYKFDINYRNLINSLDDKYDGDIKKISEELGYPITYMMLAFRPCVK